MSNKKIAIVGAGPGGLTAAMILAARGFEVDVYEKQDRVGGRNAEVELGPYRFDLGPTFLMMKFILDEMFEEAGKKSDDYMEFLELDPMYRLVFDDFEYLASRDREKVRKQLAEIFPGNEQGFDRFYERESQRFDSVFPCLQKNYASLGEFWNPIFVRATPHLAITKTLITNLDNYFTPEKLKIAFTFQAKYLGMSPWDCPGIFTILPVVEYRYGIYHVMGGLNKISEGMAKAARELGARIHLSTPVKKLVTYGRTVRGVELADGSREAADEVVVNADFAHAMTNLVEPGLLTKYTPAKLRDKRYSCSTFMLYLGVDKLYDIPQHNIVFANDYRRNIGEVSSRKVISKDFSFYVRNSAINDPSDAPEGHSSLYVLVPAPNNKSGIDWGLHKQDFRDRVIDEMEKRTPLPGLRDHIREELVITPDDWQNKYGVYLGATFNLAHNLTQMLYLRPHNKFEEMEHCYLVGGGTHPGSGLPTIYESARITANMISRAHGVPFEEPTTLDKKPA